MAFWGSPWRRARGLVYRNANGSGRKRLASTRSRHRPFERLEDRALLTVTASFVDGQLSVASDWKDEIVVDVESGFVKVNGADLDIGPIAAADVTALTIRGGLLSPNIDVAGTSRKLAERGVTIDIPRITEYVAELYATTPLESQLDAAFDSGLLTQVDVTRVTLGYVDADLLGRLSQAGISQELIDKGLEALDYFHAQDADQASRQMVMSASNPNAVGRTIFGTCGNDVIDGGEGADIIYGGAGNDQIDGAEGDDVIYGGRGNDIINGGEGNDALTGGDGVDSFNPNGAEGTDAITQDGDNMYDLCTEPIVTIDGTVVDETAGYALFAVRLNQAYDEDVTVTWQTVDGSAAAGSDFTASSGTLVIAAGLTSGTVSVPITNDTLDEPDEAFSVQITAVTNAELGAGLATCTIIDNDTPAGNQPSITVNDTTAYEADFGALFTLTLSQAINKTVRVRFATSNGTATAASEYGELSRDVYFAPNQTSLQVGVSLQNDNIFEPGTPKYFFVTLSSPLNATIGDGDGYAIIYDDDPEPTLSIADTTVTEGDPGSPTWAPFWVTLTNPADFPITADVVIGPGTALLGSDYSPSQTAVSIVIAPGYTAQDIFVPITADLVPEPQEEFYATVTTANVTTTDWQATCIITDNDKSVIVDIDTDSNNDGPINEADDPIEDIAPGRYVRNNDDDDNQNEQLDRDEAGVVTAENDLTLVTLSTSQMNYTAAELTASTVTLEITSGTQLIKLWGDSQKSQPITSGTSWSYNTFPQQLYVEGIANGPATLDWYFKDPQGVERSRDHVRVTVIQVDLDIDSDNNNEFSPPERSQNEDQVEDIAAVDAKPGKVILVSDSDGDGDGIIDWADGFNWASSNSIDDTSVGSHFIPVVLELPEGVDLNVARIVLTYDDSDPSPFPPLTDLSYFTRPSDGHVRLWGSDADVARSALSILSGGDFVPMGVYTAQELGFTARVKTFYVEALNPSAITADQAVTVRVYPTGDLASPTAWVEDRVRITSTRIEILADNHDSLPAYETFGFSQTGPPEPTSGSAEPNAYGAWQSYVVNVYDPRAGFSQITVDGTAIPIVRSGSHYTTPNPFVVVDSDDLPTIAANEPVVGELEFESSYRYPGIFLPDDVLASPISWVVQQSGSPIVLVDDDALQINTLAGNSTYSAKLSDARYWEPQKATEVEMRFKILGHDPQSSDGAFKLLLGDSAQHWEIGVRPDALLLYPNGVRTVVPLPTNLDSAGNLEDGNFHTLGVSWDAGGAQATVRVDGVTVAAVASAAGARFGLELGDTGADVGGNVLHDYVDWEHASLATEREHIFTVLPSDVIGTATVVPLSGDEVVIQYNPSGKKGLGAAKQLIKADNTVANIIDNVVTEMQAEGWTPSNPANSGEFGVEVHRRASERLDGQWWGKAKSWKTNVLVDNNTKQILSLNAPSGRAGATQVDVMYLKGNYRPKVGDILDTSKVRIYEIKTSVSGEVDSDQLGRLRSLQADNKVRIAKSPLKYQQSTGSIVSNPKFQQSIQVLSVLGAGAISAYAIIHSADADPLFEEFRQALLDTKAAQNSDDRLFEGTRAASSLKRYLDEVTGGYTDVASNLTLLHFVYHRLLPNLDTPGNSWQ